MKERRITRGNTALLPGSGFDANALLAPQQALTLYFARANLRLPETEFVPLEHAVGRVLAQRIVAEAAYPAVPRSAMDGFAVRSRETPGRLVIAGEIRIGSLWSEELPANGTVRIPTGGAVPVQADAVVPIEDVRIEGNAIHVDKCIAPGGAVTAAGSDMRAGEPILNDGRTIRGAELGVLATLGVTQVPVYRKPIIAVLSSGDELVGVDTSPGPAQIRDSNRWAIAGTLQALGAAIRHVPTSADDPLHLETLLKEAVATSDGVVLTGGSSVGERDFTPSIVDGLGNPGVIVHGLRVKPGKPTVLACIDGKPVVGLPGNPASALMILQAVATPILRALTGEQHVPCAQQASVMTSYTKRRGWTWYVPVRLDENAQPPRAYPLELHSSMSSLLARANGFITLDEDIEVLDEGVTVYVTRFI